MTHNLSPFSGSPDSTKVEHQSPYSNDNNNIAAQTSFTAAPAPAKPKAKPRKRVNTAEKRHQHNAVERQRRETLNSKFIVLARLLPSLANHRRPSKSAIVNGSISHMTKQRDQRLLAARLLRQLCAERDQLAKECNEWRAASGFHGEKIPSKSAWTDEMEEVCMVENETFGEFANMGEDGDDDQDQEGQESQETYEMGMSMGIEQATAAVASFNSTGLITPRSSTDIDPISLALGMSTTAPTQALSQTLPSAISLHHSQSLPINWAQNFQFSTPNVNIGNNVNLNAHSSDPLSGNSLGSSTGSLPFNAFMTDSLESMSSSPSGSIHGMPTPPTCNEFSRFTHTPSPRSSGSFEDGNLSNGMKAPQLQQHQQRQSQVQTQWTPQQLLFLHSVQQQQLQTSQLAEMQNRGISATAPFVSRSASSMSVGNDLSDDFVHHLHASRSSLPVYPTSAFSTSLHQQQIQQQFLQQQQQQQLPVGLQGLPGMTSEQLDVWRSVTGGTSSSSLGMGMGMWSQSQVSNPLKGF